MNYLALKTLTTTLFARPIATRAATLFTQRSIRTFSTADSLNSISQVINNFNARAEAEELTVNGISKTMSDILKAHINYEEHQQYHPISEELAFYTVKLLTQNKKPFVSLNQAKTFLEFGTQFDIQDREYWSAVMVSLQDSLQDMKAKDILSILSQLKNFGLLNNQFVSSSLQQVKEQVQTLTTPEIVLFTMIYNSEVAKSAMPRDSNFDEKLDFILSKHVEQMTAEEFACVCNAVLGKYENSNGTEQYFQTFLKESQGFAESWLANNAFSLSDLPYVIFAYSTILEDIDAEKRDSLIEKIEDNIFENSRNIKTSEAVYLVQAISRHASP